MDCIFKLITSNLYVVGRKVGEEGGKEIKSGISWNIKHICDKMRKEWWVNVTVLVSKDSKVMVGFYFLSTTPMFPLPSVSLKTESSSFASRPGELLKVAQGLVPVCAG